VRVACEDRAATSTKQRHRPTSGMSVQLIKHVMWLARRPTSRYRGPYAKNNELAGPIQSE
jgi:hypothetical protein